MKGPPIWAALLVCKRHKFKGVDPAQRFIVFIDDTFLWSNINFDKKSVF